MGNKAKNRQSNNEKKEEWPSEKTYDVFISYRRTPSNAAVQRHSTSLARSIALELESEGFSVYLDCRTDRNDFLDKIEQSKYFFVLLTSYSWDDDSDERKGGENFKKEINKIKKGIKDGNINNDNVWWLDVDDSAKNRIVDENGKDKKVQHIEYKKIKKKYQITSLRTNDDTLIKDLIDKSKNREKRRIKKFPRFSYGFTKAITKIAMPITIALVIMGGLCYFQFRNYKSTHTTLDEVVQNKELKIDALETELDLYKKECIIFAGGGTVQRYIDSVCFKDKEFSITNYTPNPGSKYIHIPSTTAWQLLWDDINEDANRKYCPIVLSTGKIETTSINTEEFTNSKRRIVEYLIDSISLKVQVFNNQDRKDTISINSLKKMLNNTSKYEIWTTTKESGTYREYKNILKEYNVDLDKIIEKKQGGWKYFNPDCLISTHDNNKTQIILANERYYYTYSDSKISDFAIASDATKKTINNVYLYVYTLSFADQTDKLEILPVAKQFLDSIGCNTDEPKSKNDGDITIRWSKR